MFTAISHRPPRPSILAIGVVAALLLTAFDASAQPSLLAPNQADSEEIVRLKSDPLNGALRQLVESSRSGNVATAMAANPGATVIQGRVGVDIVAADNASQLAQELEGLGATRVSVFGSVISAWVPIDRLEQIAALSRLKQIRPIQVTSETGSVTSQGDAALKADVARVSRNVDGDGIVVGSLSDSFDCLGDAAVNVLTDDLPAGIVVLDDSICPGTDEGRAMMQIIHDVAPGASQSFHTAFGGQADFAGGIVELAEDSDASVIVDDVVYLNEPFFQDGIIAQAADQVTAMGVAYFSSAGNYARRSYDANFRSSGIGAVYGPVGDAHDFDPGAGVDVYQQITLPPGARIRVSLQWDEPFASVSGEGSQYDLDFFLFSEDGSVLLAQSNFNNVDVDPYEILDWVNNTSDDTFNLVIESYLPGQATTPGRMKYIVFRSGITIDEYDTQSSTVIGHTNAEGTIAVGAVRYDQTPVFGVSPPVAESFSSAGNTPILLDLEGNRTIVNRNKPEIMAPDGGNNTFFGFDYEGDLLPNFFGTSAAAPHAAGVAALMLEQTPGLTPKQVEDRLIASAIDMASPGYDPETGYGLIDTTKALTKPKPKKPVLSIKDAEVFESAGRVVVKVVLNQPATTDVSVKVFSTPGTAKAGEDFFGAFKILSIPVGAQSAQIEFVILDDAIPEDTEQFTVQAVNATGATIGRSRATVTIRDKKKP